MNIEAVPVALCVMVRNINKENCEIFLQKRIEDGPLNGLYEFPGGKVEVDESPEEAAKREFLEETGTKIDSIINLNTYKYDYSDRKVKLHVFIADGSKKDMSKGAWKKLNFNNLELLISRMPQANKEILIDLKNYIDQQLPLWSHLWT